MDIPLEETAQLLARFSNVHGPSGFEDEVASVLKKELEPLVDEVEVDKMGNVIGIRKGDGPSVMIAAHMDEIGLVISHIENEGYLRFVPVGGWFEQTILGQRVLVATRDGHWIPGVVGSRPPHLMDPEERKKVVKLKDMFVDCGAESAEAAAALGIEVGSPVVLDRQACRLGGELFTGKALDNRAGIVMMLTALKLLGKEQVPATVLAVGTVQEEVGLKGARTSSYGLYPDVAIATDVTIPGDHPGVTRSEAPVQVGKGPCITILDAAGRGVIAPRSVLRWLKEAAESASIPYQLEVGNSGNTDATAISITKSGIPCSVVSVAARYIHSPVEVLSLRDLQYGAALIAEAIRNAHRYF
ncbi:MAG: M42 family metallopeptidase [Thermoleophilia bacterium]|nr:M42 family metallopeptidase [Thermoleophilia bacterium]